MKSLITSLINQIMFQMLLKCAAHDNRCNIAKNSLQNLANLSSVGSSSPGFFQANFHTTVQNVVTPGFICLVIPVYSVRAHMALQRRLVAGGTVTSFELVIVIVDV